MQYIGIDYGEKRIGLALGDNETKLATPFSVVSTVAEAAAAIREEAVETAVVGMPLSLQRKVAGQIGITEKKVRKFIDELKALVNIEIIEMDERMTTKLAKSLEGDKKTKAAKDAISAMLILQAYFDGIE